MHNRHSPHASRETAPSRFEPLDHFCGDRRGKECHQSVRPAIAQSTGCQPRPSARAFHISGADLDCSRSGSFRAVLGVCLCLFFAMQCGLSLPWRKHYSVIDFLTSRPFVCTNSENAANSSLLVLLPQLQETMFTDLLQSLLRSSNQGHRTLLPLCYSLRNHPTSCCRVALPVAGLLLISDDLELLERESRHRPGLCDGIVMVPTPLSPELNLDAVDHRDPCCEEVPPGLGRRRR
jgi:hypothetical protein